MYVSERSIFSQNILSLFCAPLPGNVCSLIRSNETMKVLISAGSEGLWYCTCVLAADAYAYHIGTS